MVCKEGENDFFASSDSFEQTIRNIEATGETQTMLFGHSVYCCDPNTRTIGYMGTLIDGEMEPISTFWGVVNLLYIPIGPEGKKVYEVTIAPEIIEEANRQCPKFPVEINKTKGIVTPDFLGCYDPRDEQTMTNRLIQAFDTAEKIGFRVELSPTGSTIIHGIAAHTS